MAELADAPDSKSGSPQGECGFDPLFRHHPSLRSVWSPEDGLRHAAPLLRGGASMHDPFKSLPLVASLGLVPSEALRRAASDERRSPARTTLFLN